MSEKKHRHRHDHDQRDSMAASTDLADVTPVDDASDKASKHQRHKLSAGPSEDDRYGEGATARDAHGQIIAVTTNGRTCDIVIDRGKDDGVGVNMEGYVKSGDGMLAELYVTKVNDTSCHATVEASVDSIDQHRDVVINPSSMPASSKPKPNMDASIIAVMVEGHQTKVLINRGIRNGGRAGQKGYVVGEGGKPLETFVTAEEHPGYVVAYLEMTVDMASSHQTVVLNTEVAHTKPAKGGHHKHGHHKHEDKPAEDKPVDASKLEA